MGAGRTARSARGRSLTVPRSAPSGSASSSSARSSQVTAELCQKAAAGRQARFLGAGRSGLIIQPMKLTALDIRQKQFSASFRGHDRKEVEAFLELIASEFEEVVKENIGLKEEMRRKQQKIDENHEREKTLQETMVSAQRISEDIKAAAKKEAELTIAEAELQGEKIVAFANRKLVQIVDDINELKRQRTQFESQLKSVIDAHQKLLETFRTATPGVKIEENVSFLASKKTAE